MDTVSEPQNKEQTGNNSSEQPSPPSSSSSDSSSGNGSSSSSGTNSPINVTTGGGNNLKPKRLQVPKACMNCRKKKAGCDRERPCKRCIQSGEEATCVDIPRKKRGPLTINSPSTPIVTAVTSIPSPVPSSTPTKEIELLANLSNSPSAPMMSALFGKIKSSESISQSNSTNTLLTTNNAGSGQTSSTQQPSAPSSSSAFEQLSKHQSLATTAPTSTPTETQLIANNLDKERAAKLLAYLVEKHNEQQLLSTFSMECTTPHNNHSELVDSASDQVLIKDYIHAIFDKASKCNDWNLAVATVVSLVEEGVHLLNCYQPRQSLVYFTGFLEGLLKYEPWVSCFQQMHQHVADVPYIVESFCAKLLEFDGILNEYEKEIIRTRLEPFRLRMDKAKPHYHDFMLIKTVGHNGHITNPTSPFVDPYDVLVTRKFIPPNQSNHSGLHYPNASMNHFQPQNTEHHAQTHSSTNNGKHPSKHMFL
mmetsp:Transcript_13023/g.17886  ORF Transcript_13023/g.17886 Transcript_13023/m.17886 type:complete len:477 (+) Transcript_13023:142-1572(+)|eukprot:CAMPEP_0168573078 /NCGR_PEP_ID=MMETSP0413-20121227/18322_1 /TAXON_ID=136452 /ORGANISM="Filamoeba nolandi, Strain NC-AS-23-1" /LENGTH=476 /DNA_ID=CAMNT_0008606263 /DNA_START=135 /DNA_END=1565 /DNA_ORIENTATION=-